MGRTFGIGFTEPSEIYRFLSLLHGTLYHVHAHASVCLLILLLVCVGALWYRKKMKRQRSPSPMPFTAHLEKKRKIETAQLFAGQLISDDLLCKCMHWLTVPEHARMTACDKRLQRLGKSERSWARNSTFDVTAMFREKRIICDPQKTWNLGCRLLTDIDVSQYTKLEVPDAFLRFYRRTLQKVAIGSDFTSCIWKCKQLTQVRCGDELSLGTVHKLLWKLPLTVLHCEVAVEAKEDFTMLNCSKLVEARIGTDLPGSGVLVMPPLPKLKRFKLDVLNASGIANGKTPIMSDAPSLTDLEFSIEAYAFDSSPPLGICIFTSQIGARLKSLNILLRYGIYRTHDSWETLTDNLLEMPVLEVLIANFMPSRALRAPVLKAAHLSVDNSTGWVNTWMFRDGALAVPHCQVDSPNTDRNEAATQARRRWPQAPCFIFYKPYFCKSCYSHVAVTDGICACRLVCDCV